MTKKQRKRLITFIKLVVSIVLIYFIFTKIDFIDVWNTLKKAKPQYLFLATIFFVLSKVIAAIRLNLYFHQLGIPLTQRSNLKLYLLGMFYNLFLPGGIGGDAYKGYLIQKEYKLGLKKTASVLILDRLSGMLLLFILTCILAFVLDFTVLHPFKWVFGVAIPLSILVFWLLNKRFFNYVLPIFWKSVGYSFLVQLSQLVAVVFILKALAIKTAHLAYLVVFLISSIVSVIPLTIGGVGSREFTFLYGAKWLNLDTDLSISISFVFFLITAFISFAGMYYHLKKPKLEVIGT